MQKVKTLQSVYAPKRWYGTLSCELVENCPKTKILKINQNGYAEFLDENKKCFRCKISEIFLTKKEMKKFLKIEKRKIEEANNRFKESLQNYIKNFYDNLSSQEW